MLEAVDDDVRRNIVMDFVQGMPTRILNVVTKAVNIYWNRYVLWMVMLLVLLPLPGTLTTHVLKVDCVFRQS